VGGQYIALDASHCAVLYWLLTNAVVENGVPGSIKVFLNILTGKSDFDY